MPPGNDLVNGADPLTLIRVLDTETTGLVNGEVCEVGWTDVRLYNDRWEIEGLPQSVLCGIEGEIEPEAQAEHHIDKSDLLGLPPFAEQLPSVYRGAAYFTAHNAEFDAQFFPDKSVPWICTMRVATALWPDLPSYKNQALRYRRGIKVANPALAVPSHRAGPDSYVTAHILIALLNQPDQRGQIHPLANFVKVSALPRRIYRFNFGKHKGMHLTEAPYDYLDWVANKSDLDRDIKWNCIREMRARDEATRAMTDSPNLFSPQQSEAI
nr:exonuclease domain-containing protein [Rhizobium leguminosarum]